MTSGVFWTKVVFIVVCWCEAFFAGCFPTWSASCRENPKILGIANAFASGVFLAIALIHILPEEVDIYFNELYPGQDIFPLPYFLMWCGYTIILVIDKVMFDTSALFKENEDPAQQKLEADLKRSLTEGGDVQQAMDNYNNPYDKFATRMQAEQPSAYPSLDDENKLAPGQVNYSEISPMSENNEPLVKEVEDVEVQKPQKKKCNCTPFMLMIALCVHATFEGIATGLQKDWGMTMEMIIAIVVHKGAAGSALGISLVKSFPKDFTLVRQLVFIFACATPLGVIIGMLCSNAGELVDVIMSSLAGGTFIYIGCTEIIVHEFSNGGYKVQKFIAYLCGAALITSLCFMDGA